jgi:hypothetical protein
VGPIISEIVHANIYAQLAVAVSGRLAASTPRNAEARFAIEVSRLLQASMTG